MNEMKQYYEDKNQIGFGGRQDLNNQTTPRQT
jgi:hypothetical protein